MTTKLTREQGLELLKKYNKEPFHILHGLTVEGTMRWFANELGYGEDADFFRFGFKADQSPVGSEP